MREQIELLKYHADIFSHLIDIAFGICNIIIVNNNSTCSRFFQTIQATQKCRFAGTGRTNQTNDFPFLDFQINPLQNLKAAKAFLQFFYFYLNHLFDNLLSTSWNAFVSTITTT